MNKEDAYSAFKSANFGKELDTKDWFEGGFDYCTIWQKEQDNARIKQLESQLAIARDALKNIGDNCNCAKCAGVCRITIDVYEQDVQEFSKLSSQQWFLKPITVVFAQLNDSSVYNQSSPPPLPLD
jgi:hypothetical protein